MGEIRVMSIPRLVAWITLIAIFAMAARISMDTDTWWHLRAGEWMVSHRAIIDRDPFSFTRYGEAWEYPGWLVQVPMYLIYQNFGPGGLNIWTAAMVGAAFGFLWSTMSGGAFLKAFLSVLAAACSGVYWSARPHLATLVFSAAYLWILEKHRQPGSTVDWRRLAWLPVIMLLWVNSHGGFAVGFILWGIYLVSELVMWIRKGGSFPGKSDFLRHPCVVLRAPPFALLAVGAGMLAAACINPSGPEMLAYPFTTLQIGALRDYIQEWQSPDFHSLSVQPFLWLLLLAIGSVGISRRRITISDFLLVSVFAYLGVLAGRNIALFSLASPIVISRHLAPLFRPAHRQVSDKLDVPPWIGRKFNLINWSILLIICLAAVWKVALIYPAESNFVEFRKYLPIEAASQLNRSGLEGRLFNPYNWGGYLVWAAPDYPVFVDGRTDLYNDEIIQEWLRVTRAEKGWDNVLEGYRVNLILTESGSTLAKTLDHAAGWSKQYSDPIAAVYRRRNPFARDGSSK